MRVFIIGMLIAAVNKYGISGLPDAINMAAFLFVAVLAMAIFGGGGSVDG